MRSLFFSFPGPNGWQPSHPALDNPVWDPSGDLRASDVAVPRPCPSVDAPPPSLRRLQSPTERTYRGPSSPTSAHIPQPPKRFSSTDRPAVQRLRQGESLLYYNKIRLLAFFSLSLFLIGGSGRRRDGGRRRNGAEHRGRRLAGWLAVAVGGKKMLARFVIPGGTQPRRLGEIGHRVLKYFTVNIGLIHRRC